MSDLVVFSMVGPMGLLMGTHLYLFSGLSLKHFFVRRPVIFEQYVNF